jgi:hypothetical protein
MAIKKYGDAQPADVFVGSEAGIVSSYIQKIGKPLSEFSDVEKDALNRDLEAAREDQVEQVQTEEAVEQAEPVKDESVIDDALNPEGGEKEEAKSDGKAKRK